MARVWNTGRVFSRTLTRISFNYLIKLQKFFRGSVMLGLNIFSRVFETDINLVGMAAINATGRSPFVDIAVVSAMPKPTMSEGQLHFFPLLGKMSCREIKEELGRCGYVLANPYNLIGFVISNPDFVEIYPVATMWDVNEKFYNIQFRNSSGLRHVCVVEHSDYWGGDYWFASVCK